jgi:mycothiol synthase
MQTATTNEIVVPGAPAIAGLRFRGFAGPDDYPRMAAVIDRSKVVDGIERTQSPEEMARFYSHLVNCDPYQDMLMVEVDGDLVGYNRVWWAQYEGDARVYWHIGFLAPEWRGKGIGRATLGWLEDRLRAIAAGHHDYDGPRAFQTDAAGTQADREALLRQAGYEPVRYGYSMVRPLADPIEVSPMPEGLEVRPVPPEKYRAVWQADTEAFRDHWGFVEPTENDYQNFITSPEFNPALWRVAFDTASGEVAGMVLNFVNQAENQEYNRKRGYTEGISVRRPWRRRGLARALLTRSLQMFKDMGMTEAALGVDTENVSGALRLYESVGFKVVKRDSLWRKPM